MNAHCAAYFIGDARGHVGGVDLDGTSANSVGASVRYHEGSFHIPVGHSNRMSYDGPYRTVLL